MIVKITLSFIDRHHQFLSEKVGQAVFATQSAAVAAALEQKMQDEQERDVALPALMLKSAPAWKHRATRSSTTMTPSLPPTAPSGRPAARELPHQVPSTRRA